MTRILDLARPAVALVVMLAATSLPCVGWAQTPVSFFDQLPARVKLGDTVLVIDTTGQERKGKLVDLSATSLALIANGGRTEWQYPSARVDTIKKQQRAPLGRGALFGLVVGVAVGGIMGAVGDCGDFSRGSCVAVEMAFLGGIGAGAGCLTAAVVPRDMQTVYQASSASRGLRVTVAPVVSPRRQGFAIGVSF